MIRLLPYYDAFKFWPGMTPASLNQTLQNTWGFNFNSDLQETQTGRVLSQDEILLDDREYYLSVYTDPPVRLPGVITRSRYQ